MERKCHFLCHLQELLPYGIFRKKVSVSTNLLMKYTINVFGVLCTWFYIVGR